MHIEIGPSVMRVSCVRQQPGAVYVVHLFDGERLTELGELIRVALRKPYDGEDIPLGYARITIESIEETD